MALNDILARLIATAGNTIGADEGNVSEWFSGNFYQDQPYFGNIHSGAQKPGGVIKPTFGVEPYTSNNGPVVLNDDTGGGALPPAPTNLNTGENTGTPTNQAPSGPSPFEQAAARARQAYDIAMQEADFILNRARGVRDEGLGMLGKRREQFQNLLDTGNQDITSEYQGRGGELGTSAQNRRTSDAAALQAQGFGGSAVERAQNRQSRDEIRALRGLMQNRDVNKRENQNQFNERDMWANTQEAALNRGYDDANQARNSLGAKAGLLYQGDVDSINREASSFDNIINQARSAFGNIQGLPAAIQNFAANPFQTNIGSTAGLLQAQAPQGLSMGTSGVQNANIDEQQRKLALLRAQAGGNMYGL